jgi:hypothetical protein
MEKYLLSFVVIAGLIFALVGSGLVFVYGKEFGTLLIIMGLLIVITPFVLQE